MTEKQLIQSISDELTHSCALPTSLPEKEIKRLIDRAKAWMFDNYWPAVEDKFMIIPAEIFQNEEFKKTRFIQMPDCVVTVYEVKEMNGIGIFGQPDRDFSDSKMLGAEIFLSPFQGDNLVYKTAMYSYFDLAKAYMLEHVAFRWNKNTKRISILGRSVLRDVSARVCVKIPDEALFDDELFVRYCYAKAKIELGRILQVFNYNLPGGITVNFDAIKQDGNEEMTAIKEEIDGQSTPDWFLQFS